MSDKRLKTKEVAALLGETVHVVRNWVKQLRPFIPFDKNDVNYALFDEEAVKVMRKIQQLHRKQGYSMKQIENYFASGEEDFAPLPEQQSPEAMSEIRELIRQQNEFNQALLQRMEEQQKAFEEWTRNRDQLTTMVLTELRETKRMQAIMWEEEQTKRPWWKFWKK